VEGVYVVDVPEKALTGEEKGWLGGLFGGGKSKYELQLHISEGADADYEVSVRDEDADPVNREFGQQVLTMLREFAS
jgi:hypothetical protein